ncbi:MAG: hypothetical protein Q4A07_11760 [Coriobacteriales bacterium]|nr:hypothetical protein [Coriobacteriales bacterium]
MTGTVSTQGFQRIWQSLLVQLICQVLLLAGLVVSDAVASVTGSYDMGHGTALVFTTIAFVARMVAWVEIVSVVGDLKGVSVHFGRASCWYLVSFCLTFAYFVTHSVASTLEATGVASLVLQSADQVVATLKDVTPLIALAQLAGGFAEYLDSLGEPVRRHKSLLRLRTFLMWIALLEAVLSIPTVLLGALAPDSMVYGALSLILALVYVSGFFAQAVGTAKARSIWKTIEEVLG